MYIRKNVDQWKISLICGINYEGHRNGPLQSTLVCAAMGFYEITIIAMAVKKARRYHERKIWEKVCAIRQDLYHADIRFNFEYEYSSPLTNISFISNQLKGSPPLEGSSHQGGCRNNSVSEEEACSKQ